MIEMIDWSNDTKYLDASNNKMLGVNNNKITDHNDFTAANLAAII